MSKVNLLIIGTGSIGERHVRCFLATDRATVSICEPGEAVRNRVTETYNIEKVFASTDEALAQSWDAVLIATPAHTHIPIARKALQTGAALLIEKPLSTNLEGVDALRDEAKEHSALVAVSYNHRAHPGIQAMKAKLDTGELGKPLQLISCSGQDFAFYRPAYADTYFARHESGGGALQDAITHNLNVGEYLVGPITRITADAAHQALPNVEVEDTVTALARHGTVLATYTINLYQSPNESAMTIICEKGTIRFELHESRLRFMTETEGQWHDSLHPLADRDDWYIRNAHAFLDAREGKAPPLCTLEEGAQTLRANLAARQSINSQAWCAVHNDY